MFVPCGHPPARQQSSFTYQAHPAGPGFPKAEPSAAAVIVTNPSCQTLPTLKFSPLLERGARTFRRYQALQNAASIAGLFLTTEAVVADKPEKNAPAMGGGDEMGGMGGF